MSKFRTRYSSADPLDHVQRSFCAFDYLSPLLLTVRRRQLPRRTMCHLSNFRLRGSFYDSCCMPFGPNLIDNSRSIARSLVSV